MNFYSDYIETSEIFSNNFDNELIIIDTIVKDIYKNFNITSQDQFNHIFEVNSKKISVSLNKLIPTQRFVIKEVLESKLSKHFRKSHAQAFKVNGKLYLYDGHHTTSANILDKHKSELVLVWNVG